MNLEPPRRRRSARVPALVVAHLHDRPDWLGMVALFPEPAVETPTNSQGYDNRPRSGTGADAAQPPRSFIGQGVRADDPRTPLAFVRQRPGGNDPVGALPPIGGVPVEVELYREPGQMAIIVEGRPRGPIFRNGRAVTRATLVPGDVLRIGHELVLFCTERPTCLLADLDPSKAQRLAELETTTLVGMSEAAWKLRLAILCCALPEHAFILGEPGSGKEVVVHLLHTLLPRTPLVVANCAQLRGKIGESELFGYARGVFTGQAPEGKTGLLAAAHRGTLFLDEIGELEGAVQATLLRVLLTGKLSRAGEQTVHDVDLWALLATHCNIDDRLRPDFRSRIMGRIEVPPLRERREDIPLIAQQLLRSRVAEVERKAGGDGEHYRKFSFVPGAHEGEPDWSDPRRRRPAKDLHFRLSARLVESLLLAPYDEQNANIRAVDKCLRRSAAESRPWRRGTEDVWILDIDADRVPPEPAGPSRPEALPPAPTPAVALEALDRNHQNQTHAALELGISRHALRRLIEKTK